MKYIPIIFVVLLFSCSNNKNEGGIIKTYARSIELIAQEYDISKIDPLQQLLIGTKLGNYNFIDLRGNEINLDKINRPIFLQATASWCKPCKALTPALNEIVEKYNDQVDFILLTHDTKEKAKTFARGLHPKIILVPSKSKKNPNSTDKLDVGGFKQVFPFPTTYFITMDKIVSEIKTGAPVPQDSSEQEVKKLQDFIIQEFSESIEKLIL